MEQEVQKLNQLLSEIGWLHAELDYGENYGVDDADTIIVIDGWGNIVAEGETADEILTQLKTYKL